MEHEGIRGNYVMNTIPMISQLIKFMFINKVLNLIAWVYMCNYKVVHLFRISPKYINKIYNHHTSWNFTYSMDIQKV